MVHKQIKILSRYKIKSILTMNFIEKINKLISAETINKLSSVTGESIVATEKGIKTAISMILASLTYKSNEELDLITKQAKTTFNDAEQDQNFAVILKSIFGDQLEEILFNAATYAKIKQKSMHLIANNAVVCAFEVMKELTGFGLEAVESLMIKNKAEILNLVPTDFNQDLTKKATFLNIKTKATDAYVITKEEITETKN